MCGANGSGKTVLLEAIGMLSAALNGRVDNSALQGRGVRLGTPQLYKSAFKTIEAQSINLSFKWQDQPSNDKLEYSVTLENSNQSPSAWYYQTENVHWNDKLIMQNLGVRHGIGFENIHNKIKNNQLQDFLEAIKSYAIYSPTTPGLRDL